MKRRATAGAGFEKACNGGCGSGACVGGVCVCDGGRVPIGPRGGAEGVAGAYWGAHCERACPEPPPEAGGGSGGAGGGGLVARGGGTAAWMTAHPKP